MHHIIYISKAAGHFSQEDLIELLKICRVNNSANQITGMLLYLNGKFIQVLEGPEVEVQRTFEKIKNDERHYRVIKVLQGNYPERVFSDWQMGFRVVTQEDLDTVSGLKDIDSYFQENLNLEKGNLLLTMLSIFYKKNINDFVFNE